MGEYDTIAKIQQELSDSERIGEILAAVRNNKLDSVQEVVDYFMDEWRATAALTRDELRRKLDQEVDLRPGSMHGHIRTKGREKKYDIDSIIDSLQDWGEQVKEILGELHTHFKDCFKKHHDFKKKLP